MCRLGKVNDEWDALTISYMASTHLQKNEETDPLHFMNLRRIDINLSLNFLLFLTLLMVQRYYAKKEKDVFEAPSLQDSGLAFELLNFN